MARIAEIDKKKRADKIFSAVRGSPLGIMASEVSSEVGLPVRTVYNYLYGLEKEGRLYRDGRCWFYDYGY
jgi:DNA-binding IclR family transcriptional regulator